MQIKDKLPHNIIEAMSKSSNKELADGYVRFLSEEEITEIESIVKNHICGMMEYRLQLLFLEM